MTRVFVDGQEGTTGLRIHEMLAARGDLEVLAIDPAKRKDASERARLLNAADVAFLCLPDAAAREAVALVTNPRTCLIDASTAHRIAPEWTFGLPELSPGQRGRLREAKRIANPGCHSTGFLLLVRPLVDAGLLPADAVLSATSISGYSGGGKKLIAEYEPEAGARDPLLDAPRAYALALQHKHLPEMQVHGKLARKPVFLPIVGPFYKGMAVSVPLGTSQLAAGATAERLREAFVARYADERFVRVASAEACAAAAALPFDPMACNDTNRAEIFVFSGDDRILLACRLDNLGKGASGAAVQCMNVHLGVDEATGLG
jgi:N-acetyl-gamma-glutamyl-phosphate reductase